MNIKMIISYDGSAFNGSQTQPDKTAVADRIYEALNSVNIETKLHFSGRTDKGVHATAQVLSCVIPDYWSDLYKLKNILNKALPFSIRVKSIKEVDESFHARYSAKKRVYRYLISTKEPTPFDSKYITFHEKELDTKILKKALGEFIGIHDFEYFCKAGSGVKTTVREIYAASLYRYKDVYVLKFCANGFLRSQIRLMAAMLLKISDGSLAISDLKNRLRKKENFLLKPAPSNGLYLAKVLY